MTKIKSKKQNIKKAGSFYFFGTLFNKGIAFLTVPIFTRLLTTSEYGVFTTYNSWVGILAMILGLALHMAIRASFIDYYEKIKSFFSSIVVFSLLYSISLCSIIVFVIKLLNVNVSLLMVVLCLAQGFSNAILEDFSVYLMMQYKYKGRTLLMILPNLLSSVLSIIAIMYVVKNEKYWGLIVSHASVFILIATVIIITHIFDNGKIRINKEYIKYGLKISTPLIVHGLALNVLSQSDRIMITGLADSSQTGIYSLVYNFSMVATVITTAMEGVWVPWFTEKLKKEKRELINKYAVDYVNFMTYIMIGLILVGPEILKLISGKAFWEGVSIIPPVVLANYIIFVYTLYVNIEHFHKKTVRISINTIIAALSNIVLNFIFIPYFGYIAAAFTTLASYIICMILHSIASKKVERDLYPLKTFAWPLVSMSICVVLFYVFIDYAICRWIIVLLFELFILIKERKKIAFFIKNK